MTYNTVIKNQIKLFYNRTIANRSNINFISDETQKQNHKFGTITLNL